MRKALVIIAIMASLVLAEQLSLTLLWSYKAGGKIWGLAFDDNGNLGVASDDNCAYILDPNGYLLNKVCGSNAMEDASYSDGRFGFINDDGYAYIITDENWNLIKKVHVGYDYDYAITMTPDGFVACGCSRCAFFDFYGNKLWDVEVEWVDNGPAYYNGYWYVPSYYDSYYQYADDINWNKLLIIKDGKIVNEISYEENDYDAAVCGNYLAVSTKHYLYLYNLSDPENPNLIWRIGGFNSTWQVAFSPDCKYIAVTNANELKIYDINENLVLEKYYGSSGSDEVWSVAWWKDRIAVGLEDGTVYMYKVYIPITVITVTTTYVTSYPVYITTTVTKYLTNTTTTTYTTVLTSWVTTTVTTTTTMLNTTTTTVTTTTTEVQVFGKKIPGVALLAPIALVAALGKRKRKK